MLLSGLGSFEMATQNSPWVSTVRSTFNETMASAGRGVDIPKTPCSLKLLTPKFKLSLDAEIPKAGTLENKQSPVPLVSDKSGLLEITCQRSRQPMGGDTGVGVAVSVGVGEMVSVNGITVSVEVGGSVGLTSIVAVAGTTVLVGSGFCMAAMIWGDTEISAATIVPVTPRSAMTTV